ncbi:MAG: type II toxin-antitoxin system RelE/ParE family toxin [Immundisolibacteraceae bacterium]|nr:type II toxin-antitoxin system RelE/ParE family toxin [Immundisolibacteraceae bacterium]
MKPIYKFSEQAQQDLTHIVDYTLKTWWQDQAHSYIDGLEARAKSLAQTLQIAKLYPDIHEGLRCFPYESHLLYFIEATHGINHCASTS